jgi:hypothetical protein
MPNIFKRYPLNDSTIATLNDFTGGINYALPPEEIAMNEMAYAENFEMDYMSGILQTPDGLTIEFDAAVIIDSLYYDSLHDVYLFSSGTDLYKTDFTTKTSLGTLTGALTPSFISFGGNIFIASGGKPQYYTGETLTTISAKASDGTTDLTADIVLVRDGRLVFSKAGRDELLYSGTGDFSNWNYVGTDSDAKYVEIGYKDDTDIVGVVSLSQYLLVFKSDGKKTHNALRLTGEYPDWVLTDVSGNADCANSHSVAQALNDVYFIGKTNGFTSLSTVQDYGVVKMQDTGFKVNKILTPMIDSSCQLFYVPARRQIWIVADSSGNVYIYNFATQCFTKRTTTSRITGIATKDADMYVSIGQKIFRVDSNASTDDGSAISSLMQLKRFRVPGKNIVIKRLAITLSSATRTIGTVTAGGLVVAFDTSSIGKDIVSDTTDVVSDTDEIASNPYQCFSVRGNCRCEYFDPVVSVTSGKCSIRGIEILYAEVQG